MGKLKHKTITPSWTPVELNEAVLAGGVEGLIGIEELSNYTLENNQVKFSNCTRNTNKFSKSNTPTNSCRPVKKQTSDLKNEQCNLNLKFKNKFKDKIQKVDSKIKNSHPESIKNTKNSCLDDKISEHSTPLNIFADSEEIVDVLPWTSLFVPIPVAKALLEQGFKEPTEIQRLAIPPAVKGRRDILGAAETGSGKTLAFGIPIIHGILTNIEKKSESKKSSEEDSLSESDTENIENEGIGCIRVVNLGSDKNYSPSQKLWALVLTPTRELAVQVKNHLMAALKYTDLKVVAVVGGMSVEKQQRLLKQQPHIVVATPGRLWELVSQGEPIFNCIEDIRYLVIDETDRMTEVNHFPELRSLLEKINSDPAKQKLRQNFVFSATLTLIHDLPRHTKLKKKKRKLVLSPEDKLKNLIDLLGITKPKIIDVTRKQGTSELLTESSIVCSLDQKDYYLFYFLQRHPGRTLVFCNSISCVRRLASLLSVLGMKPLPIHANMLQKQRLKNLERFRDSPDGLLLATDVAARGLDIPNVQHVIHYQVPRTSETYVHRSGRTARANHEGLTLLLIESAEQQQYIRLMRTLNREKELPRFPIMSSLMDAVKQRVNLAREIDKMQLEYKKATSKFNWVEKAAEEMDLLLDDDEKPEKVNDRAASVIKRQVAAKQKQLKSLLKQSLRPRGFSFKYPLMNENVKTAAGAFKSYQSAIEAVKSTINDKEYKRKRIGTAFSAKKKKLSHNSE